MKRSGLVPLPIGELLKMKKGDKYIVYWAKDDNPEYIRYNYVTETVESIKDGVLSPKGCCDEWYPKDCDPREHHKNSFSCSGRGNVYFYKVPEKKKTKRKTK